MIFALWNMSENARLVVCTVHEPANPPADRIDRAEALVFVKDGFSLSAALLTPLWLALHRMWVVLAGYLAVVSLLSSGMAAAGLADHWIGLANLAVGLIIGFEADSLKRWTLEQSGATTVATVAGRNFAECERRFFDNWLPSQPIIRVGSARDVTSEPVLLAPALATGSETVSAAGDVQLAAVSEKADQRGWLQRLIWR